MKCTPNDTVASAISLLRGGLSIGPVAAALAISKSTVARIRRTHLPSLPKNRAGRPKLLSERDVSAAKRYLVSGEVDTATDAVKLLENATGKKVSPITLRRALKSKGAKAVVKKKRPLLKVEHRRARLKFARRHKDWTVDDWRCVVWSDETKINRFGSDGREWCWKFPKEPLSLRHCNPTVKYGGGSIMMWGCMTSLGPGLIKNIPGKMDQYVYQDILTNQLVGTFERYGVDRRAVIFQHDNDPKHTAKSTVKWLKDNNFRVLEWPSQSPDLNPIEHLWHLIKRRLAKYERQPRGMIELWERVEVEWGKITAEDCMKLIESMPRRVRAVLEAKGGVTKY